MRTLRRLACLLGALFCATAASASDDDGFKLLDIEGHSVKWGAPVMGAGAVITYAVATASTAAAGTENCRRTGAIGTLLRRSQISMRDFDLALAQALAMWSDVADVHFVAAAPGVRPDLVIAAEADPDGVAYSDVTPASEADSGVLTIARAVVCLNPQIAWSARRSNAGNSYRLFYVLAHEIGHTIGLDHPGPSGVLMSFEYSPTLQSLQPGDIAAAVTLYGAARHAAVAAHTALR